MRKPLLLLALSALLAGIMLPVCEKMRMRADDAHFRYLKTHLVLVPVPETTASEMATLRQKGLLPLPMLTAPLLVTIPVSEAEEVHPTIRWVQLQNGSCIFEVRLYASRYFGRGFELRIVDVASNRVLHKGPIRQSREGEDYQAVLHSLIYAHRDGDLFAKLGLTPRPSG